MTVHSPQVLPRGRVADQFAQRGPLSADSLGPPLDGLLPCRYVEGHRRKLSLESLKEEREELVRDEEAILIREPIALVDAAPRDGGKEGPQAWC